MKKLIWLLVVALLLPVLACASAGTSTETTSTYTGEEPPIDRTWISPGKVQVGNFYPGARAEWPLTIHNGNDHSATFQIGYRYPDRVESGYAEPTPGVQDWVIIADPTPVLDPYETRDILIVLDMPVDTQSPGKRWEFWISVKDTSQAGLVQTELCSKWLITTK